MRSRAVAAALLAALLAACGALPRRGPEAGAPAAQPAAAYPGGGGYYKNDGPGANPPPNLGSIPDAEPKREPLSAVANRPYQALGKEYVPLTRLQPYHERGLASWYGRRYNGLKTSSGERYDMYAMTAAHPTLPIPSYARVTNLSNGRSVVVRINDRGPFWPGRVIDLSYAAAYKLGIVASGSAPVEVDSIVPGLVQPAQQEVDLGVPGGGAAQPAPLASSAPASPPPVAAPPAASSPVAAQSAAPDPASTQPAPAGVYLQLGAFSARASAESFRARVYRELGWLSDAIHVLAANGLYKLQLGPYGTPEQARSVATRIQAELNFKPLFVVR
ncbi:MAG: septal ring lytic transglycosylase RlpA family protein [Betaproteobacteria bacterium]|nr:septal ring lytic transglycosylase RlpA family protein [Betaproteobacteria bacterium]